MVLKIEDLEKVRAADYEYDENLMEVQQALDADIKDYRKMIEDEEGRFAKQNMM